jgi:hypothetical protein
LLIGRYLFFQYGNAVVFFGRFIAVLRIFAALLAGANCMPAGRFFFFNIIGGICWACLFGFGAYAAGTEIYKIFGTLSVISLGVFLAAGYALSIFVRRNEVKLRRRAEVALSDHSCGWQPLMARLRHADRLRGCLFIAVLWRKRHRKFKRPRLSLPQRRHQCDARPVAHFTATEPLTAREVAERVLVAHDIT